MDLGINDEAMLCTNCRSVYQVYTTPGAMDLTADVTSRHHELWGFPIRATRESERGCHCSARTSRSSKLPGTSTD
jgi:hypothetical protein